ncbi:CpsD/CapB family tyrosine-protein kinase [Qipengyuania sphaerica]|uniref:CpsD/CapB family tyrosine-protein kinase n=1 Tax=Qipengyuania sphaerica TaxID=2867243 RepID=UPI001C869C83|nr:CpsD/CapB family tyrosine-protein kinase [Qipengyuania sphaerica]MBX7539390.1 CpsD/CapB family tyrosine-protein kinase [Qipengyuania sphaerica]
MTIDSHASTFLGATDTLDISLLPEISFDERPAPPALLRNASGLALRPFSLMRSKVLQKLSENDVTMVGVTSATPNVGKSTLSIALAASLEQVAERPVVLVDLDLRRGSVAEYLDLDVGVGVSDYLSEPSIGLQSIAVRMQNSDLVVLPTGTVPKKTAELLSGPGLGKLVASLKALPTKPICVFDLPPAFANDDTIIALQNLDGYFLIVESGKTTKRHILDLLKILAPAKCFGTILNRYEGMIGDSYSYGSTAYSRYYE